jgi:enoyl-CoA hydratase/carnithine racemase
VPIARTLGQLPVDELVSLLVSQLGPARSLDLLLRRRLLTAEQAHAAGFVSELADDDEALDEVAAAWCSRCCARPLTMWAAKQAVTRLRRASLPDGDDFVARTFGSDDFHRAVQSFSARERRCGRAAEPRRPGTPRVTASRARPGSAR